MTRSIYYITSRSGSYIEWVSENKDLPIVGQMAAVIGNLGKDWVYVGAGTTVDASSLGLDQDRVYFTGNLNDYTQIIKGNTYVFNRIGTGDPESITVAVQSHADTWVFADGTVEVSFDTHFDRTAGGYRQVQNSELNTILQTPAVTAIHNPEVDTEPILVFIAGASSQHIPAVRAGMSLNVTGNAGDDSVFVGAGSTLDASRLGPGKDVIYVTGKLSDYTQSISGNTYTLRRSLGSETETLIFAVQTHVDRVVFDDGFINVSFGTHFDSNALSYRVLDPSDLNRLAPVFPNGSNHSVSIDENAASSTVIYNAQASDNGGSADHGITYSLSGADASAFNLSSSGELTLKTPADYETKASYSIGMVATDAAGNHSTQTLTVNVNDLDELAPVFPNGSWHRVRIDENAASLTVIYNAQASDNGGSADHGITYSLSGADASAFNLSSSGELTLKTPADYETKASYSIGIVATDAVGNRSTQTLTGNVNNLDDVGFIGPITGGTIQGHTLTAGTIVDADGGLSSVRYQWQADGSNIKGATNNTYTLTQDEVGKRVRVVAIYSDNSGSGRSVSSKPTSIVADTPPKIAKLKITSDAGPDHAYAAGDSVQVTVTMSENTVVDTTNGTPQIALHVGTNTRQAIYASGSGSTDLVFEYRIIDGDADTDGISIAANSLKTNGGKLQDLAGNTAILTHDELGNNNQHRVITAKPAADGLTYGDDNADGDLTEGETVTLKFTEMVDLSKLFLSSFTISNSHNFGGGASIATSSGFARELTIILGSSPTIVGNDTITVAKEDVATAFGNTPNSDLVYTFRADITPTDAPMHANTTLFGDNKISQSELSAGVSVSFNVDASQITGINALNIYVDGIFATSRNFEWWDVWANPLSVNLGAKELGDDGFKDISATITDSSGNESAHSTIQTITLDTTVGGIESIELASDGKTIGVLDRGDKIIVNFAEAVKLDKSGSAIDAFDAASVGSFGAGATVTAINPDNGFSSQWEITVGRSPTLNSSSTVALQPKTVRDVLENSNSNTISAQVPDGFFTVRLAPAINNVAINNVIDGNERKSGVDVNISLNGSNAQIGDIVRLYIDEQEVAHATINGNASGTITVNLSGAQWGSDGVKGLSARIDATINTPAGNLSAASVVREVQLAADTTHWSANSIWFDPNIIAQAPGSTLSKWEAASGNSIASDDGVVRHRPTVTSTGGKNSLYFNGSNTLSFTDPDSLLPAGAGNLNVFAVARANSGSGWRWISAAGNGSNATLALGHNGTSLALSGYGSGNEYFLSDAIAIGKAYLLTATKRDLMLNVYSKGNEVVQAGADDTLKSTFSFNPVRRYISGQTHNNDNRNEFFNGDIMDIVWSSKKLTKAEQQEIETYLAAKWEIEGIAVTSDGTAWNMTTSAVSTVLIDQRAVTGGGSDTINVAGSDYVRAGGGDDTVIISDFNFRQLDAGVGADTLALSGTLSAENINLSDYVSKARSNADGWHKLFGFEKIDLSTSASAQTMQLTAKDIDQLSDTKVLEVNLGHDDTLILDSSFFRVNNAVYNGTIYTDAYKATVGSDEVRLYVNTPTFINLTDSDPIALSHGMLKLGNTSADPTNVEIVVAGSAGVRILRSGARVSKFTLDDVYKGLIQIERISGENPFVSYRVNDEGTWQALTKTIEFNELELLKEIEISPKKLGNQYEIELTGVLDKDFVEPSKLQISKDNGSTWETVDVSPNITTIKKLDYTDSGWVGKSFNYNGSWAGTGFGLSGTQRGAPEDIVITTIEGQQVLAYRSQDRDRAWYSAHPEAREHNVYKNADGESQDDFFMNGVSWNASENVSTMGHVYKNPDNGDDVLAFRMTVITESGTKYWPGMWIYDSYIAVRGPGRSDIWLGRLPQFNHQDHEGWLTTGMQITPDGNIYYYLAPGLVDSPFESQYLIGDNKSMSEERFLPYHKVVTQRDAIIMISNRVFGEYNAIQDLAYTKQLSDTKWTYSDPQNYDADAELSYKFRILNRDGSVADEFSYNNLKVHDLVSSNGKVLTDNESLYGGIAPLGKIARSERSDKDGAETLWGGAGNDTFEFNSDSLDGGRKTIEGFEKGDKLVFAADLFESADLGLHLELVNDTNNNATVLKVNDEASSDFTNPSLTIVLASLNSYACVTQMMNEGALVIVA